jgi:chromosomal replication initiation ATPase DnaA
MDNQLNKPNIFKIEIPATIHNIPGITNLSYTYSKVEKQIVIRVDRIVVHLITGEMATFLFQKAAGFLEEQDEAIVELGFRLGKTFGTTIEELKSKRRDRDLFVIPRQVGMWWLKNNTKKSLRLIGEVFGKDHATALHAIKTINNLIDTDKEFVEKIINKFVE